MTQMIRPEGLVRSPVFSHVAVIPTGATTILVGGQNAVDAEGALIGGDDVAAQTRKVMENVRTALAAAGATLDDVVSWSITFVDGVDVEAAYAAAAPFLATDRDPPLVTAAKVAGLAVPGALVEASATAAVAP
ncbi:MAG TPA: Rid family hydrolase [Intrasporangium sp.]|nr:Rid family hydrolase [Intrasporangium sp.]